MTDLPSDEQYRQELHVHEKIEFYARKRKHEAQQRYLQAIQIGDGAAMVLAILALVFIATVVGFMTFATVRVFV